MFVIQGKSCAFEPHEIGCVNHSIIVSLVIFTILHMP